MKLNEALLTVRQTYPSYEEFIKEDHSVKIGSLLGLVGALEENGLAAFARRLKSSESEIVLSALAGCGDGRICGMLMRILELRFRKKLFELNWTMLQADYSNKRLLEAMERIADCMKDKYPADYASSIFARLGGVPRDGLPGRVYGLLRDEGTDIRVFCKKYGLNGNSPLGVAVRELFFLNCGKDGFTANRDDFACLAERLEEEQAAEVVACYIDKLDPREYFDNVIYALIEKYGEPGASGFWRLMPEKCAGMILRWQDLKRVEAHFGKGVRRFRLWSDYFGYAGRIIRDEAADLLIMDFGSFAVVDFKEEDDSSYLYDSKYFDRELERYEQDKQAEDAENVAWRIIPEHVADARDFIIEGVKSEVYRIGYDRVRLLYLKEIMKVKLGL